MMLIVSGLLAVVYSTHKVCYVWGSKVMLEL